MRGSEFAKSIVSLAPSARSAALLAADASGYVPTWLGDVPWRPVTIVGDVDGKKRTLVLYVAPDVYSIGEDGDFLRVPMTPRDAQTIATRRRSILPSRKLARDIFRSASAKVVMPTIPMGASAVGDWLSQNERINSALAGRSPFEHLIAGHKKDIVVGPNLDGSHVAIFGGMRPSPDASANPLDPWAWQTYPGPHDSAYLDYSHGVRLVFGKAHLDGEIVDVASLFVHPRLHVLVSDQGPFVPEFPNAGKLTPTSTTPATSPGPGTPPAAAPSQSAPMAKPYQEDVRTFNIDRLLAFAGIMVGFFSILGRIQGRR